MAVGVRESESQKSLAPGQPDKRAPGVLLLHSTPPQHSRDVIESIRAFRRESAFPVFPVNLFYGAPPGVTQIDFDAIALHYTMFYSGFSAITPEIIGLLERAERAFKIALFQDEQACIGERVAFCEHQGIDLVYTCIEPPYSQQIYGDVVPRVRTYLPGYVSPWLVEVGEKLGDPNSERPIDIGYRGRKPPAEWGDAAQEKYEIAIRFEERARGQGLRLDIATDEESRIYGPAWPRFIASCKAMLGAESGATIDASALSGDPVVPYRTIGPRHFEAAALGTCQILFEGHYSGALAPLRHYIPLKKDFSNLAEVLARFSDRALRVELATRAREELIRSGAYAYGAFVGGFDRELQDAGLEPDRTAAEATAAALYPSKLRRRGYRMYRGARALVRRARDRIATRA